jgi:vacuolar-type H+-ATPase subunit E/Vma4
LKGQIIENAENDKKRLIYESEIVIEAKEEAEKILKEAREEAERIKSEGREFVKDLLSKIDNYLLKARNIISDAIDAISEEESD